MTPPNLPIISGTSSSSAVSSATPSLDDLLSTSRLLRDETNETNAEDPLHWASQWETDQHFRTGEHPELMIALSDLRRYLQSGSMSDAARTRLEHWAQGSAAEAGSVDQVVLQNLGAVLSLRDASLPQDRFQSLADLLGIERTEPEAEPEVATGMPRISAGEVSDFQVQSATLGFHFADAAMRDWPRAYTLGVLPPEGLSQSLSSSFGGSAGLDWAWNGFRFLTDLYASEGVPDGAPSEHLAQFGVRFGIHSYGGFGAGDFNGPRIRILGGLSRTGFGLGAAVCTSVDGSAVSGAGCDGNAAFQLSAFSESDLLTLGWGPVELGVRTLFNNQVGYINFGGTAMPEVDRDPLSFRLSYYFRDPTADSLTPEERLFPTSVSDPEIFNDGVSLLNNYVLDHFRRRQEGAYEVSRAVVIGGPFGTTGSAAQYSLLNTGTFFNGVLNGFTEGSMAYRLSRDLRLGNDPQRVTLGAMMGLEFLVNTVGALATPGTPDDLQGAAFRLAIPANLVQDTLAVLGATGILGNRDAAIRGEGLVHFGAAHGLLALAGVALILTSGDFSGNGFFNYSILGNTPPDETMVALESSRFSIDSQRSQAWRMEVGMMALSYALQAGLDVFFGTFNYANLRAAEAEHRDTGESDGEEETPSSASTGGVPLTAGIETDGHSRFMATVGGSF